MNDRIWRIVATTITIFLLTSFLAEVRANAKDEQHNPLTSFTVIAEGKNGNYSFQIGIEKEKFKLTETVFEQNSVSMGAVNETISSMGIELTEEQINALRQSESIKIMSDTSWIAVEAWYQIFGAPYGCLTHLHLSNIDAINVDTATNAAIALFGLLTVLLLETLVGAVVCGVITFLAVVLKIDYEAMHGSNDQNPDGSFDMWFEVVPWTLYMVNAGWVTAMTPLYVWAVTRFGAYIIGERYNPPLPPPSRCGRGIYWGGGCRSFQL